VPDLIVQQLYEGKSLTFLPVPEPTEEEIEEWEDSGGSLFKKRPPVSEWAEQYEISTDYELLQRSPSAKSNGKASAKLQTLHYPDLLEARVGNLYRTSRTMVEESGSNPLFLSLGFLEWYEAGNSQKAHYAPLYTVPVALEKGSINRTTNTYEYALSLREDEVQFNASIAVRLAEDYGFVFPELNQEHMPEEYLSIVMTAIASRFPRWKVHRWGTLAMFNFSRLQMFRDLNPENWPEGHGLDEHPLVSAVIQGKEQEVEAPIRGESSDTTEYSIDLVKDVYNLYPLVDVADSSQHSALIDAIKGKNLVIQGPPGTGKSQTITNLIAAAMQSGQSVLFVSEKMAALDVVKHRMEKLGLGDFCLELHNHNSKKVGVIESLKRRLEKRFPDSQQFATQVQRHESLSQELNTHEEKVNQLWKRTELTILQILTRCVRFWIEVPDEWDDLRITGLTGVTWTPTQHVQTFTEFEAYAEQLSQIVRSLNKGHRFEEHPWRGIHTDNLDSGAVLQIKILIQKWNASLSDLQALAEAVPGGAHLMLPGFTIEEIKATEKAIQLMPVEGGNVHWKTLGVIREKAMRELESLLTSVDEIAEKCLALGSLTILEVVESDAIPSLHKSIKNLLQTQIQPETKLIYLSEINRSVIELINLFDLWSKRFEEFREYAKENVPPFLDSTKISLHSLRELSTVIVMNGKLSQDELSCRCEKLLPHVAKDDIRDFRNTLVNLKKMRDQLDSLYILSAFREEINLDLIIGSLKDHSFFNRIFSADYRNARKQVRQRMRNPKDDWNPHTICTSLLMLKNYLVEERQFEAEQKWKDLLGSVFQGIDTELSSYDRLVNWHENLAELFAERKGKLFADPELCQNGQWLLKVNTNMLQILNRFEESGFSYDLERLENLLSKVTHVYGHLELPTKAGLFETEDSWRSILEYLKESLPGIISQLDGLGTNPPETLDQAYSLLAEYMNLRADWKDLIKKYFEIDLFYFSHSLPKSLLPTKNIRDTVSATKRWCTWLDQADVYKSLSPQFIQHASIDFAAKLRDWCLKVGPLISKELEARECFTVFVSLALHEWSVDLSITSLQSRIKEALRAENLLPQYLAYLRLRGILSEKGFITACKMAELVGIQKKNCHAIYEYLVTSTLAEEIFEEIEYFRRFDAVLHSQKIGSFRDCDQSLMKQTQIRTAAITAKRKPPQGIRGARVSEHTELQLILHEVEKQKRHIPLRQLMRRAGNAVQALKPCFMMGPRSVAQYLEPGAIEFDLLVIDEASQMRPADALGAIARCKQLVVVGDSKQLAPTSFFDRILQADEDDDEQFEATISESILDAVAPVFSRRQLRWHYRSKHPSLIAFSNRHFYDNRLMLFPSPHFGGDALGIKLHKINDGVFENQVNTVEAQYVAQRVVDLLLEDSSMSVGVATMNAKQRDMIERLLEEHAKEDESFAEAYEVNQNETEPLFIMNLENVQGHERDVMLISCTYGRTSQGGKVMQRFGPINSSEGGRRLNVLFTRSRTRMEIFSSMASSDIIISEKSSEGVRAFRGMLRYAETGIIEGAVSSGREPDSDFEVAVAQMLVNHGYEVECQIGVAGFFIDLGVKHPSRDGEYIMGVECDGAAYHSSKSARDRDRIRQDILESMGWTIGRIWSTDWFMDPENALQPILEELEKLTNED
jgi:very-short-patch-repair endonuclease/DNA polymerase III delta prime subunit